MSRTCTKCNLTKGLAAFRPQRRICKVCEYDRRDLKAEVFATRRYRARHRAELNRKQREAAQEHRKWMDSLKIGRACADCSVVYPPYVMDWDHTRGEKSFNLGHARQRYGYSGIRDQVLTEIKKCDLVCANCHRERTHRRQMTELPDFAAFESLSRWRFNISMAFQLGGVL